MLSTVILSKLGNFNLLALNFQEFLFQLFNDFKIILLFHFGRFNLIF